MERSPTVKKVKPSKKKAYRKIAEISLMWKKSRDRKSLMKCGLLSNNSFYSSWL